VIALHHGAGGAGGAVGGAVVQRDL